jgi:hypothetical protein
LSATISDVGGHFLEDHLDGLVVELHQVVEGEHLVHDLLGQVGSWPRIDSITVVSMTVPIMLMISAAVLHAAQRGLADLVAAGQHLVQHLVQVLQRGGLDAFERGDAQHDLVALSVP